MRLGSLPRAVINPKLPYTLNPDPKTQHHASSCRYQIRFYAKRFGVEGFLVGFGAESFAVRLGRAERLGAVS